MELVESSFDLMSNPLLKMRQRESWMISKPFVLNDAIIIKQKIKVMPKKKEKKKEKKEISKKISPKKDTINMEIDSVK